MHEYAATIADDAGDCPLRGLHQRKVRSPASLLAHSRSQLTLNTVRGGLAASLEARGLGTMMAHGCTLAQFAFLPGIAVIPAHLGHMAIGCGQTRNLHHYAHHSAGLLDAGCWMLDAGCWLLAAGCGAAFLPHDLLRRPRPARPAHLIPTASHPSHKPSHHHPFLLLLPQHFPADYHQISPSITNQLLPSHLRAFDD